MEADQHSEVVDVDLEGPEGLDDVAASGFVGWEAAR